MDTPAFSRALSLAALSLRASSPSPGTSNSLILPFKLSPPNSIATRLSSLALTPSRSPLSQSSASALTAEEGALDPSLKPGLSCCCCCGPSEVSLEMDRGPPITRLSGGSAVVSRLAPSVSAESSSGGERERTGDGRRFSRGIPDHPTHLPFLADCTSSTSFQQDMRRGSNRRGIFNMTAKPRPNRPTIINLFSGGKLRTKLPQMADDAQKYPNTPTILYRTTHRHTVERIITRILFLVGWASSWWRGSAFRWDIIDRIRAGSTKATSPRPVSEEGHRRIPEKSGPICTGFTCPSGVVTKVVWALPITGAVVAMTAAVMKSAIVKTT
mmetsp:Transcript_49866/g.98267  ORF Transcript_49866/g.98267 Transcript_49866/m.98267 type:complete len:327 (+) Transcript_49866:1244-2224(+)